jgi:hypothetical protein
MYLESNGDVDAFKGRLLGVEDELIDALINGSYTSPPTRQPAHEQSASSQASSQPDHWKGRLLGAEEELIDALTSPSERRDSNVSQAYGPTGVRHSHPDPQPESHRRGSICAVRSIWGSVEVQDNGIGHEIQEDGRMFNHRASVSTTLPDMDHVETIHSTPTTRSLQSSSPLAIGSESPQVFATSIDPDSLVVDSIILERPGNISFLGTWDLNEWQATVGDLFAVKTDGIDRHGLISSY